MSNRLSGSGRYDAAGNLVENGVYTYNAEGMISSVNYGGALQYTYGYDGDGNRVIKNPGKLYWAFSTMGSLAESDLAGNIGTEYIYFDGKRVARIDLRTDGSTADVHYYFSDHLGSASVVADETGRIDQQSEYFPYGGERVITCCDTNVHKFTGKERDSETGLDYFGARYYGSNMGRFTSPDPVMMTAVRMVNPQRLNLYSYAVNNPLHYIDPNGEDAVAVNFLTEVPLGGHEGILNIHTDGSASYARFGPRNGQFLHDEGEVRLYTLSTKVEFGKDGLPTGKSYQKLAQEVADFEGQSPDTVGFNYFKTTETDSLLLQNWMKEMKAASDAHKAPFYAVQVQNCAVFTLAGLTQAHVLGYGEKVGWGATIPNRLFMLLGLRAAENWTPQKPKPPEASVTVTNCTTGPDGKKQCTTF